MESFRLDLQSPRPAERIFSIDVFRGMTILVMIFVNLLDMSVIRHTPWWIKHATFSNPKPDFMTIADFIAPAFLFVVGAAIPLALGRRIERGQPWWRIAWHILVRTVSLLIIGVCMGNMRIADVLKTLDDPVVRPIGLTHASWSVLLLGSFILVWNDYPRATGFKRAAFILLRLLGLGVLVYLALIYREERGPDVNGMKLRWYVIGMIGWAYLTACVVYLLFRRQVAGVTGCVALLIALYMGDRAGVFNRFHFLDGVRQYLALGSIIGSRGAITVMGVIVGMLLTEHSPVRTPRGRIGWVLTLGAGAFAAGYLLRPLYGLSVPTASPTWILYCAGYCCLSYALLYWLTDVRQVRGWAGFAVPAGKNALLPYFLSFMFIPLLLTLRLGWVNDYLSEGIPGILRTVGVSLLIGWGVTAALSRLGVRLRL